MYEVLVTRERLSKFQTDVLEIICRSVPDFDFTDDRDYSIPAAAARVLSELRIPADKCYLPVNYKWSVELVADVVEVTFSDAYRNYQLAVTADDIIDAQNELMSFNERFGKAWDAKSEQSKVYHLVDNPLKFRVHERTEVGTVDEFVESRERAVYERAFIRALLKAPRNVRIQHRHIKRIA